MALKKELHKDYAALCNSSTVEGSSELLFGDLSKLAKDISEANKLTKKVRPPHSTNSRGTLEVWFQPGKQKISPLHKREAL